MKQLLLCLLLVTSAVHAEETSPVATPKKSFEVGLSGGYPALIGIQLGYWGDLLVARASIGIGSVVDIGIHLPAGSNPDHRLYIVASGGVGYGYTTDLPTSIGPTVGIRLGALFLQGGPCVYFNTRYTGSTQLAAQGMAGFSILY